LAPITASRIATPGKVAIHQYPKMNSRPWLSMAPHSGVGGWAPRPRKLRVAATRRAFPRPRVVSTMTGARTLGTTWRPMILRSAPPDARLASMNVRVFTSSTAPFTIRT
jgi:hypothetical protein